MAERIPLSDLLTTPRAAALPVSIDAGVIVDWAAFTTHVAGLAAVLAVRGPGRWLLFTESTYAFAVGLMAVWQAGAVAVLAPNGQPGTLSALAHGTHGLITERERVTPPLDRVPAIVDGGPRTWRWIDLDRKTPRLELFTSGSTGRPTAVVKTVANLDDEVAGLEARWGDVMRERQVVGTVSHQHIYGLLFRVLWPLSAGRVFHARTFLQPEEIAPRMHRPCALVSSPAHLSRLKGFPDAERMAKQCGVIFSSGGPLDRATAMILERTFGAAPFEVFGSTETGGVAWRQQDGAAGSEAWTPFPGVAVDRDPALGLLRVQSPFVSGGRPFTLGDRVECHADGRFAVGARSDRIVKLGDKRVALPEMEARLGDHPFVSRVALQVVGHGTGARLGAAVVLTPAGLEALAGQGRRVVSHALARTLAPYWDRVLLPRVWRYVDQLPEDAQGKVTVTGLHALFAGGDDGAANAPELLDESIAEGVRQQTLRVPATLACLDGHFPDFPVVPGAVQIGWVMAVTRRMFGEEARLAGIETLKFRHVLRRGDVFQLRVERSSTGSRIDFRLWNDRATFSSGRCLLAPLRPDGS